MTKHFGHAHFTDHKLYVFDFAIYLANILRHANTMLKLLARTNRVMGIC